MDLTRSLHRNRAASDDIGLSCTAGTTADTFVNEILFIDYALPIERYFIVYRTEPHIYYLGNYHFIDY